MANDKKEWVFLLLLGGLAYGWLSGQFGRLLQKGGEEIGDVLDSLPPRIHPGEVKGELPLSDVPREVWGSHEGWYDYFRIEGPIGDDRRQAAQLLMGRRRLDVDDKEVALVGDPVALFYFGRALANLSGSEPIRLERHPFSPMGAGGLPNPAFLSDEAYVLGYGFAFREAAVGRRVVLRLQSPVDQGAGVNWNYMGQSHWSVPGQPVVSWINIGATHHYEVFIDRLGEWV